MIRKLGSVLSHNYPGVEGIDTLDGVIVRWPDGIGTQPDADALQTMSDAFNALRDWEIQIATTDAALPRISEDIIDTMSEIQKAKLPQIIRDRHAAKKILRDQRPV